MPVKSSTHTYVSVPGMRVGTMFSRRYTACMMQSSGTSPDVRPCAQQLYVTARPWDKLDAGHMDSCLSIEANLSPRMIARFIHAECARDGHGLVLAAPLQRLGQLLEGRVEVPVTGPQVSRQSRNCTENEGAEGSARNLMRVMGFSV